MDEERDAEFVPRAEHGGIARLQSKAEARLGLLAAGMREYAIFVLDAAGRVESWDDGAERIMGYRGDEIIGRHFSAFAPAEPGAADTADWQLAQAAEFGRHVDEGWRLRRDGTRFWAHAVITAQKSPEGSVRGFIQVIRDETEAGTRQQRSSRRFTDLFDLAPAGIALSTTPGRYWMPTRRCAACSATGCLNSPPCPPRACCTRTTVARASSRTRQQRPRR